MSDEELRRLEWEFRANLDEESALRFALAYIRRHEPKPVETPEQKINRCHGILERDYMEDVSSIADDIKDRIRRGEIDEDSLYDAVSEAVDGCARVIYTNQAKETMRYSSNSEASVEQGLLDTQNWGRDGINWSQLAYSAVHEDVMRMLGNIDWSEVEEEETDEDEASNDETDEDTE